MLFFFKDRLFGHATFTKGELSLILGLYGERVKRGEWRDYAIDSLPDMAVFSIFRSSRENPAFSIAKMPPRGKKPLRYTAYAGTDVIKESTNLSDVINCFEDLT